MNTESIIDQADLLARKAVMAIWSTLPEEGHNAGELEAQISRLLLRTGAAVRADWDTFQEEARRWRPRENPYARHREVYPNAGKAWAAQDDDTLRRLFQPGSSFKELCEVLGRS